MFQPGRVTRPIRLLTGLSWVAILQGSADFAHRKRFGTVFRPRAKAALPQKILIVEQQLIEARARHIHEAKLRLARCRRGTTALRDVLPTAARRLYHLVNQPARFPDKPLAERYRAVVDDGRGAETSQRAIAPAGTQAFTANRFDRSARPVRSLRIFALLRHTPPREASSARPDDCILYPNCGTTRRPLLFWRARLPLATFPSRSMSSPSASTPANG